MKQGQLTAIGIVGLSFGLHLLLIMTLEQVCEPKSPSLPLKKNQIKAISAHLVIASAPQPNQPEQVQPIAIQSKPEAPTEKATAEPDKLIENQPTPATRSRQPLLATSSLSQSQQQRIRQALQKREPPATATTTDSRPQLERLLKPRAELMRLSANSKPLLPPKPQKRKRIPKKPWQLHSPVIEEFTQSDGSLIVQTKDGGCYLVQDRAQLDPLESGKVWLLSSGCKPKESAALQALKKRLKEIGRNHSQPTGGQ